MLIQQKLETARTSVQALYDRYRALRGETEDHVDQDLLAARMTRLNDLSVLLVVAGEVSSGKSSFINAFLGTDLLPISTLQSSSAVVEIAHGQRHLHVQYADGSDRSVGEDDPDWDDSVRHVLAEVAAVPDAYRDLPVVHLRQFVADHHASASFEQDVDTYLAALADDATTNPRQLPPADFRKRGRRFLDVLGAPEQIATEIRLRHPLPHGSPIVKVVDTPGVNAIGGVESVTRAYIHNADALLFVQSLASPIESKSFRSFVEENVKDRLKETLFLILTHAARENPSSREARVNEAHRIYTPVVGKPGRILPVDSVLHQVYLDAREAASADDLLDRYEEQQHGGGGEEALASEKEALLAPLARRERKNGFACLQEAVRDQAGFDAVHEAISEYATNAPYLQIAEVLDEISRGLANLQGYHEDQRRVHKEGAKGAGALRQELDQRRREVAELRDLLAEEEHTISTEFTNLETGIVPQETTKKKEDWQSRLDAATTESAMRTVVLSAQDDADRLRKSWTRRLARRCQKTLRDEAERVFIPDIEVLPPIDVDAIAEGPRTENTRPVSEGTPFMRTTEYRLDDVAFRKALRKHLKSTVSQRAENYRTHFERTTLPFVVSQVSSRLKDVFDRKEAECDDLEEAHQSAEQHDAAAREHAEAATEATHLLRSIANARATFYTEPIA